MAAWAQQRGQCGPGLGPLVALDQRCRLFGSERPGFGELGLITEAKPEMGRANAAADIYPIASSGSAPEHGLALGDAPKRGG